MLDPDQSFRVFRRRSRGLNARSILVLILAAAAAYLSLAPSFTQLPLPSLVDIVANPTLGIGSLLVLQILAILIGVDIFSLGFSELFHGRPCRETLVSVAIVAAILHSVSLLVFPEQNGVTTPYIAASILMLYAMMREDRGRYAARARSYKAVAQADQLLAVYSHYDDVDDACRAAKGPLFNKNDFLTELERPDTVDRFSMIYAPLALALSIIFALVSSLGRGEPVRFFWAFSSITIVAAPIGLLCAFGAGYKNIARRLLASGAALAGARQANLLRGTEEVVLAENDLFPTGSIELEAIDNLGRITDEQILGCAAALTESAGLELGRVLTDTTKERFGITFTARDVRLVEGGVTGAVGTSRIVLGTAALMVKMGIPIESGHKGQINMYLVVDNALAGVLTMRYQTTKNTYKAMRLMRRMHMNAVLAVRDFNISPAMIEEEFDLRRGFADQPDPAGVDRLLNPNYAKGDAPAAILTREGAGPFMQVLRGADKLAGAVRSALTLGTFAGLHLDGDDRIGHNSVLVSAKYKVVSAAVLFPHGTVHLPFGIPLSHGIPLIVGFLTLTQAQLHLHAGVFEVDGQGDQGVTILLLHGVELADLPLVQQQALGTVGVAVEDVALLIGRDVEAVGIDLAVLGDAEGILQVQRAGADGFDLRAEQLDAGLVAVLHKIVVERFAVLGGDLDAGLFHGRTSFPCGLIHIV